VAGASSKSQKDGLIIVCLSDTHELHREVDVPNGDILLHAGDFTMFSRSARAILDFNEWLGLLPHSHKIIIPGNHEFFLEADPSRRRLIKNATVLIDEAISVSGVKIWGTPTTPLYGGAFGRSSPSDRARIYARMPPDVDIVISHGPPLGILDATPGTRLSGCAELLHVIKQLKPKLHVFGHIHGSHGVASDEHTTFVNAALLGIHGDIDKSPIVLRLPRRYGSWTLEP
jgi:Icc-related predicted phosphoesterase